MISRLSLLLSHIIKCQCTLSHDCPSVSGVTPKGVDKIVDYLNIIKHNNTQRLAHLIAVLFIDRSVVYIYIYIMYFNDSIKHHVLPRLHYYVLTRLYCHKVYRDISL